MKNKFKGFLISLTFSENKTLARIPFIYIYFSTSWRALELAIQLLISALEISERNTQISFF